MMVFLDVCCLIVTFLKKKMQLVSKFPPPLTVGGGHDFSLLPRRLHRPSDPEQLPNLQAAAAVLGLSQLLQLSDRVEASLSPIAAFSRCYIMTNTGYYTRVCGNINECVKHL